jgi:hypothetical protein
MTQLGNTSSATHILSSYVINATTAYQSRMELVASHACAVLCHVNTAYRTWPSSVIAKAHTPHLVRQYIAIVSLVLQAMAYQTRMEVVASHAVLFHVNTAYRTWPKHTGIRQIPRPSSVIAKAHRAHLMRQYFAAV